MKLVNARLGLELEFLENQVLNLTIESPERFSEVVYNLSKQVEGEEGEFILSNAEKELLLEKKAVVIANPLGVTCDEKRIVSQIYKNLSEKISSDYSEEYAVVNQQILQFVEKIINYSEYNLTLDVDFQATGLVKYCNVHMDSCYDNFAEKFIDYLRAVKMICNVDIVFVLNLKQYFSIEELKEIYKHCFYTKLSLMNLEGIKTDPIVFQFLLVKRQYIAATGRVHGTDDVIAYHVRSMWHTDRQVTLRNSGRNMRKKFCFTRLLRMLLMRYMYNIPVPQTDKGFPFFEKATLAYFPKNIFDLIKRAYRY